MILYLDAHTRKITDEKGRTVHVNNARVFWESGQVRDYNLSFERLAGFDFDFDKLDKFYNSY